MMYPQLIQDEDLEEFRTKLAAAEVLRPAVVLGDELGRGQTGLVFRASVSEPGPPRAGRRATPAPGARKPGQQFAVKVAATPAGGPVSPEERSTMDTALMAEGLLLLGLQHPRIIRLVSIVTDSTPCMICTELMPNGDLKTFLRACRTRGLNSLQLGSGSGSGSSAQSPAPAPALARPEDRAPSVTPLAMHQMAARLAAAMAFLERRGIIHRDLAARNVLVGETAIDVKLADLGAARDVLRAEGGQVCVLP